MQKSVLKKCLDEINKETPDISYLKGMLEVLMEVVDKPMIMPSPNMPMAVPPGTPVNMGDIRYAPKEGNAGGVTSNSVGTPASFSKPEGSIGPADPYDTSSSLRDALPKKK